MTYISVPDSVILPSQPKEINLVEVVLLDDLKDQIKKASVHVQLINQRVRNKIAEKYSVSDELKALRSGDTFEYNQYAEECRNWGKGEKAKLGL